MMHHYESMAEIQEVGRKMDSSGIIEFFSGIVNKDTVKISLLEQYKYWKQEIECCNTLTCKIVAGIETCQGL